MTQTIKTALGSAFMLSALIGLASCSGTGSPESTATDTPTSFFARNGVPTQKQSFTAGTASTLTFNQGTELTFSPASVLNSDDTVYTGPVNISMREIQTKSEMLLSNVLTISDQSPLVSGGMFWMELKTPEGVTLKIAQQAGVAAKVPIRGKAFEQMQQFINNPLGCGGKDVVSTPPIPLAPGDSSVNWCPVGGQFGINMNTTPGNYVFAVYGTGWTNCDFFYSDPRPKTTMLVKFDAINDDNTILFMVPKGITSVISLYTKAGANTRTTYANSVPIGMETELIAITFNNGKQYLAHKTVTIAANSTETLTFSESTDAATKTYLATLNGS